MDKEFKAKAKLFFSVLSQGKYGSISVYYEKKKIFSAKSQWLDQLHVHKTIRPDPNMVRWQQMNSTRCMSLVFYAYAKTIAWPAVALPMASDFNEKECMDLKKWKDCWILHLIDMFTRFSVSIFINRKRSSEVIDKIMKCWVSVFDVMGP